MIRTHEVVLSGFAHAQ